MACSRALSALKDTPTVPYMSLPLVAYCRSGGGQRSVPVFKGGPPVTPRPMAAVGRRGGHGRAPSDLAEERKLVIARAAGRPLPDIAVRHHLRAAPACLQHARVSHSRPDKPRAAQHRGQRLQKKPAATAPQGGVTPPCTSAPGLATSRAPCKHGGQARSREGDGAPAVRSVLLVGQVV